MIVDYHMHLRAPDESLDHTVEGVERFVEVARERGVDEIGFSEHVYYFRQTQEFWDVPYQRERCVYDLDRYCDAVVEAKVRGLPVKLGLEVDWVPGREDAFRRVLEPYPWDFLLGSIHFIDGLGIDGEPRLVAEIGPAEAQRRYFEELEALANSGLADVLAHPDLIKFFGDRVDRDWAELVARLDGEGIDESPGIWATHSVEDVWLRYFAALAELAPFVDALAHPDLPKIFGRRPPDPAAFYPSLEGVALEISTGGLRKPVGELYPDRALLELGLPITLASDAHVPQHVGEDFDRALELARSVGYETVTVFEGRRARQEPLG